MHLTGKVANDGFKSVSEDHYIIHHHKIPRIWVIVTDGQKARVFMKPDGHLEQIAEAVPQGGHAVHRDGDNDHHVFVQEIAVWLDEAVHANAFDRLVLAASPKMLGNFRKALSVSVQSRLVAQIDKDLTKMNEKELFAELVKIVWF